MNGKNVSKLSLEGRSAALLEDGYLVFAERKVLVDWMPSAAGGKCGACS